jgi:adenylate kinase
MIRAIILLGAPGAGKGTTAERIRDLCGYEHVSTGDMLRRAVKKGTAVGREAESYMKQGELVPDDVIIRLVEERMDEEGGEGAYMFDGFPRTDAQADLLEKSLASRGGRLTHVFLLDAPRDILIARLTGRRACRQCGKNYHIVNLTPERDGRCDDCGGELFQRPDDKEDTIVNRLDVYREQTESLISRYEGRGVLVRVDSARQADRIVHDIAEILKNAADGA